MEVDSDEVSLLSTKIQVRTRRDKHIESLSGIASQSADMSI